jgi:hypothetical protein
MFLACLARTQRMVEAYSSHAIFEDKKYKKVYRSYKRVTETAIPQGVIVLLNRKLSSKTYLQFSVSS